MLIIVQDELTLLLFHHLVLIFGILGIEVRNLIMRRNYPRMLPEVGGGAYFLNVEALHLILREPLLHAPAYESLTIF